MVDVTKEFLERSRRVNAIRREIAVCDGIINAGVSESADIAHAEKAALRAELDYIKAQFDADIALKAMAESALDFAQRPPVPKGDDWHDYIWRESKDYDDYREWFHEYINSRDSRESVRDLTEKQNAAKKSEQLWLQALERWDEEHTRRTSSMESNIPNDTDHRSRNS
ncbi:MAG TPA: hypothetical protein PLB62_11980 [Candidatus Sumerlaeota bacterium]|nr:hypothetical protein [Candidatus Sumerlaeota bacterium]